MSKNKLTWKKGKGKLGPLAPLIGKWKAETDSPMGHLFCTRSFESVLGNKYVQLNASWKFAKYSYEETALYGVNKDGKLSFWSFTSDGKQSQGKLSKATDVHPDAVCFEAQMPAGLARMIYWPDEQEGFYWAVESKNKKGWKRFTLHHYKKSE